MAIKDYEMVKSRKLRLRKEHPEAVIIPEMVSPVETAMEFVIFKASIWTDRESHIKGEPPDSVGFSLSVAGGERADKTSWTENCEESAVGRALDNLGYYGDKRVEEPTCSREEITNAQQNKKALAEAAKPMPAADREVLNAKLCGDIKYDEVDLPEGLTVGEGRDLWRVAEQHLRKEISQADAREQVEALLEAPRKRAA